MSGTNRQLDVATLEQRRSRLLAVLGGEISLDSLGSLIIAMSGKPPICGGIASSAIGLDANVILRLPTHKKGPDVIDYLDQRFSGPLILPAQAVQEFWNNNLAVIETVGQKLKKQFGALNAAADQLGPEFNEFAKRIKVLLEDFDGQFGYSYDESTHHKVGRFLETLKKKAYLSLIDRMEFFHIAEMRMKTKTPPGFCDDGHGDFYIWLELLNGAMKAIEDGNDFDRLILVSNDRKEDWVRKGVPHPVLSAEAKELVGKPFVIWTLDQFVSAVKSELG